jgi:hypothetical protein
LDAINGPDEFGQEAELLLTKARVSLVINCIFSSSRRHGVVRLGRADTRCSSEILQSIYLRELEIESAHSIQIEVKTARVGL